MSRKKNRRHQQRAQSKPVGAGAMRSPAGVNHVDGSRPGNEYDREEVGAKGYYGRLVSALRASVPGGWASDHYEETLHCTGWNYIAANSIGMQAAAASLEISRPIGPVDAWSGKVYRKRYSRLHKHSGRERYFQSIAARGRGVGKSHDQDMGDTEDREVLPESFRLCKLLNRPNPSQSGGHLRYEASIQLSQTGTALIVKIPNKFGLPVELYCVPTCLMTPRPPTSQFPYGAYYVSPAATRTNWADDSFVTMVGYQRLAGLTIDMRDLIKISFPHPLWKDEGYSALAACSLWSDASEQIDRARFSQFMNGCDPSMVLTPPDGVNPSDNEIERVLQKLKAEWVGTKNTGKIIVTPGGSEATPWSTTPREMAYGEGFDQLRNAIMGGHGVPLIAAGITDGGSYAAFYAALKQFITLCVQPRLDWIAEELTYQLAEEFGVGLMIRLIAAAIDDPAILEARLNTDIAARAITKNEIRAMRGLSERDDGDVWAGERVSETVRAEAQAPEAMVSELAGAADGGDESTTGISTGQTKPANPAAHFAGVANGAPSIGADMGGGGGKSIPDMMSKKVRPQTDPSRRESLRQAIERAAKETDTNPSEAQKESGNYSKGRFRWNGLTIVLENPKGSVRRGIDADGNEWSIKMPLHYGYISRSEGSDGDHVDVFVGPSPESELIFVVDQVRQDGTFDEHKVVIGTLGEKEARAAYLSAYENGWTGLGAITPMTVKEFKVWLGGDTSQPVGMRKRSAGFNRLSAAMAIAESQLWNGQSEGVNYP